MVIVMRMRPDWDWLLSMRLFEFVTTFIMLGMVGVVVMLPAAFEQSACRYVVSVGFTPLLLAVLLAGVGGVRLVALFANGHWPLWGPRLRAIGAAGGAFIWCWLCVAAIGTGEPPIEVVNWLGLLVGEAVSCARAGTDAKRQPA